VSTVHVVFSSAVSAYSFVSEIRRQSDSLLWDVRVRPRQDGAEVLIPSLAWTLEPFIRRVAAAHGGDVEGDPHNQPSDAPEGM
jgi:hypothetical protein